MSCISGVIKRIERVSASVSVVCCVGTGEKKYLDIVETGVIWVTKDDFTVINVKSNVENWVVE